MLQISIDHVISNVLSIQHSSSEEWEPHHGRLLLVAKVLQLDDLPAPSFEILMSPTLNHIKRHIESSEWKVRSQAALALGLDTVHAVF